MPCPCRSPFIPLLILASLLVSCEQGDRHRGTPGATADAAEPAPSVPSGSGTDGNAHAPTSVDSIRMVFLGTSLTAGLGLLRDEERYTERVRARAAAAGLPVQVVNAGVSGETSAGGLRRLDWALDDPVDVLVVELGANDGLRGHDPAALESNLRQIVRQARERHPGIRIVLMGMEAPPNLGRGYTTRFRRVFPTVARDLDVELVPFLLEGVAGVDSLNQDDGIHPNPAGHARMARNAWAILRPVLEAEAADRAATAPEPEEPGGGGGP